MPIQLDTPFEFHRGHGLPVEVCSLVKIIGFGAETAVERVFRIEVQYGNVVGGIWVASYAETRTFHIVNTPAVMGIDPETGEPGEAEPADMAYDDMTEAARTQLPPGSKIEEELGLSLYTWLLANVAEYAGTILP